MRKRNRILLGILAFLSLIIGSYFVYTKYQADQAKTLITKMYEAKDDHKQKIAKEIIKLYPKYKAANQARLYLSQKLSKEGKYPQAIRHLKDIQSSDPSILEIKWTNMAKCYKKQGKHKKSLDAFNKAYNAITRVASPQTCLSLLEAYDHEKNNQTNTKKKEEITQKQIGIAKKCLSEYGSNIGMPNEQELSRILNKIQGYLEN